MRSARTASVMFNERASTESCDVLQRNNPWSATLCVLGTLFTSLNDIQSEKKKEKCSLKTANNSDRSFPASTGHCLNYPARWQM